MPPWQLNERRAPMGTVSRLARAASQGIAGAREAASPGASKSRRRPSIRCGPLALDLLAPGQKAGGAHIKRGLRPSMAIWRGAIQAVPRTALSTSFKKRARFRGPASQPAGLRATFGRAA
jgi:hypothetical protein